MPRGLKQDLSIGKNLKALREAAGLSQEQVAAQLQVMEFNISREIISQMENGKHSIKIGVLCALKKIYRVESFNAFFSGL